MSDVSDRIADIVRAQDLAAPNLIAELDDGGLVSDGRVGLSMAWPQGQDWIARRGMIETLRDLQRVTDDD